MCIWPIRPPDPPSDLAFSHSLYATCSHPRSWGPLCHAPSRLIQTHNVHFSICAQCAKPSLEHLWVTCKALHHSRLIQTHKVQVILVKIRHKNHGVRFRKRLLMFGVTRNANSCVLDKSLFTSRCAVFQIIWYWHRRVYSGGSLKTGTSHPVSLHETQVAVSIWQPWNENGFNAPTLFRCHIWRVGVRMGW